MDDATRRYGIDAEGSIARARMGNERDQFLADLGFRTSDRGSYWDAIRSGLLDG